MVSADSRTQREKKRKLTERYKYARNGPELALDLYIRAIAIESKRSGWPLEVIPTPRGSCTAGRTAGRERGMAGGTRLRT